MRKILPILLSVLCFVSCPIGGGAGADVYDLSADVYDLSIDRTKAKEIAVHALDKLICKLEVWEDSIYKESTSTPSGIPASIDVTFNSKHYTLPLLQRDFGINLEGSGEVFLRYIENAFRKHESLQVNSSWNWSNFEYFEDQPGAGKARIAIHQGSNADEYKVSLTMYYFEDEMAAPQMYYCESLVDVIDGSNGLEVDLKKGVFLRGNAENISAQHSSEKSFIKAYQNHYWYESTESNSSVSVNEVNQFLKSFITDSERSQFNELSQRGTPVSKLQGLGFIDISNCDPRSCGPIYHYEDDPDFCH